MHCGQVDVQHACLPRVRLAPLGLHPFLNPSALGPGAQRASGLLLEAAPLSHWLRLPSFCVLRTGFRTDEGFCSALAGGFFMGSILSEVAWTQDWPSMLRAWSPNEGREGRASASLQTDLGNSPSNRAPCWRARPRHLPDSLEDGCRLLWVLRAAGAEAHPVGQLPGQLPLPLS